MIRTSSPALRLAIAFTVASVLAGCRGKGAAGPGAGQGKDQPKEVGSETLSGHAGDGEVVGAISDQDFNQALEPAAVSGTNLRSNLALSQEVADAIVVDELVFDAQGLPSWRMLRSIPVTGTRFTLTGLPRDRYLRLTYGAARGILPPLGAFQLGVVLGGSSRAGADLFEQTLAFETCRAALRRRVFDTPAFASIASVTAATIRHRTAAPPSYSQLASAFCAAQAEAMTGAAEADLLQRIASGVQAMALGTTVLAAFDAGTFDARSLANAGVKVGGLTTSRLTIAKLGDENRDVKVFYVILRAADAIGGTVAPELIAKLTIAAYAMTPEALTASLDVVIEESTLATKTLADADIKTEVAPTLPSPPAIQEPSAAPTTEATTEPTTSPATAPEPGAASPNPEPTPEPAPPAPTLHLDDPNGGESLLIGSAFEIKWTKSAGVGAVALDVSTNDGATWTEIATGLSGGQHTWVNGGPATTRSRIRVRSAAAPLLLDASDAAFSIHVPVIGDIMPNGGQTYTVGDNVLVSWESVDDFGTVDILLSIGGSTVSLASATANDGLETIAIPNSVTNQAQIRVRSTALPDYFADSASTFTIESVAPGSGFGVEHRIAAGVIPSTTRPFVAASGLGQFAVGYPTGNPATPAVSWYNVSQGWSGVEGVASTVLDQGELRVRPAFEGGSSLIVAYGGGAGRVRAKHNALPPADWSMVNAETITPNDGDATLGPFVASSGGLVGVFYRLGPGAGAPRSVIHKMGVVDWLANLPTDPGNNLASNDVATCGSPVNSHPTLFAVWSDGNQLFVSKYTGTTWTLIQSLATNGASVGKVGCAASAQGDVIITYVEVGNGDDSIMATRWEHSGPGNLETPFAIFGHVHVLGVDALLPVISPDGMKATIILKNSGSKTIASTNCSTTIGILSCEFAVTLAAGFTDLNQALGLSAAMDLTGNTLLVWKRRALSASVEEYIQYTISDYATSSWSAPAQVGDAFSNSTTLSDPHLAYDASLNRFIVGWGEWTTNWNVVTRFYDP